MRKIGNWMPSKDDIGSNKWNDVKSLVNDNFYFIENERYDLDAVLAKGAELVKRKGIKCLVIDPYNKVKMKMYSCCGRAVFCGPDYRSPTSLHW